MAAESTPSGPPEPPATVTVNGQEYPSLADGEYDAIVLGTGLKEVLLAGMLAKEQGKRVLVIDRNGYYGGEAASLNVDELYRKFIDGKADEASAEFKASLGDNRDYCVDLVPKFVMADGLLVKILLKMSAQDYVDFRLVDGSYVYKHATAVLWGKAQLLHKVPATQAEALTTSLVSMWGKRGLKNFLGYIQNWTEGDASTADGFDAATQTAAELYAKFGLDEGTIDFVGHAMALQDSDAYLAAPAVALIKAIKLYAYSLAAHSKSPYLYPVYGLSTLPEAFSRVCSLRGGIFMLNHDVSEVLFGKDGKVAGVRVGEQAATAPIIIADPSYAPADRKKTVGKTIRTIALLDHPVPELKELGSAQVIIPQKQVKRAHDVYMTLLSRQHNVVADGKYLAIISTVAETATPQAEVAAGIELCGPLLCRFDNVTDTYVAVDDGTKDNFFVTSSLDATSHFESVAKEVLAIWKRVTGADFDLTVPNEGGAGGGSA